MTWLADHGLLSVVNIFSKLQVASFSHGGKYSTTSAGEFLTNQRDNAYFPVLKRHK